MSSLTMPHIPLLPPLPTLAPEDPNIKPKLDALVVILTVIAGIVVGLRIYQKYTWASHIWWDDYIAIVSWTLLAGLAIAVSFEVHNGVGRHASHLDAATIRAFNLADDIGSTVAIAVTSLAKTGLAATLLRGARGGVRTAIWCVLGLVNSASGVAGTIIWVQCTPLRKNFDDTSFGSCFPAAVRVGVQVMNTAISGIADVVLSLLGVYIVYKMETRRGYWFGALFCAALGIFAGITGFLKSGIMHILAGNDLTFDSVMLIVWGVLEPALIIIAASLPELRGLLWNKPQPVRYDPQDFMPRRRAGALSDVDYEYARRQYVDAGSKSASYWSDGMEM